MNKIEEGTQYDFKTITNDQFNGIYIIYNSYRFQNSKGIRQILYIWSHKSDGALENSHGNLLRQFIICFINGSCGRH